MSLDRRYRSCWICSKAGWRWHGIQCIYIYIDNDWHMKHFADCGNGARPRLALIPKGAQLLPISFLKQELQLPCWPWPHQGSCSFAVLSSTSANGLLHLTHLPHNPKCSSQAGMCTQMESAITTSIYQILQVVWLLLDMLGPHDRCKTFLLTLCTWTRGALSPAALEQAAIEERSATDLFQHKLPWLHCSWSGLETIAPCAPWSWE